MTDRWPVYSADVARRVAAAVSNNQHVEFARNPYVEEIECRVARLFRRKYAVAMNSGTSGLLAAYYALGLAPGARVFAPAYTFYATVTAMLPLGLEPVLLDLEADTLNVSAATLSQAVPGDARAIVVTHNWGNAIAPEQLHAMKARTGLPLIDDCSHMFGTPEQAEFFTSPRVSDISVVSAGARKIVSGGAGGFVLTDDATFHDRMIEFCQPKRANLYVDPLLKKMAGYVTGGVNARISVLSAILILDHLDHIDAIRETWLQAAQEAVSRVRRLVGCVVPRHDANATCWYKVPVILPAEDPQSVERLRASVAGMGATIDPSVKPFFEFERFSYPRSLGDFTQYAGIHRRLQIVDLSGTVASRYASRGGR
jgi:dTDP-4-amino-4,6-dideoxygalactose transaminase